MQITWQMFHPIETVLVASMVISLFTCLWEETIGRWVYPLIVCVVVQLMVLIGTCAIPGFWFPDFLWVKLVSGVIVAGFIFFGIKRVLAELRSQKTVDESST